MSQQLATKLTQALNRLDGAIESAAASAACLVNEDPRIAARLESYREVVRRQRALVSDISTAAARRDWREVARLGSLLQKASILIKLDLDHIVSSIKSLKGDALKAAA